MTNGQYKNHRLAHALHSAIYLSCMLFALVVTFSAVVNAQTNATEPPVDISSSNFSFSVCDGPGVGVDATGKDRTPPAVNTYDGNGNVTGTRPYVICNFNTLMLQIQHLINIAIVLGVLFSIICFCYAGYLYITHGAESGKRSEANDVFRKVFIGFILMLSAWFIVYQFLSWLAKPGVTALLGNPS